MATSKKPRPAAPARASASASTSASTSTPAPTFIPKAEDQPATEPLFRDDRIRLAAYRLSLTREPGQTDPLADWLEAEAEVDAEDAA